ncbi:MAG: hypothetical protein EBX90_11435 [Betaproteobacteria bacterium]|nr:hypothetical protein [Betaproteobacteria bacterium]
MSKVGQLLAWTSSEAKSASAISPRRCIALNRLNNPLKFIDLVGRAESGFYNSLHIQRQSRFVVDKSGLAH